MQTRHRKGIHVLCVGVAREYVGARGAREQVRRGERVTARRGEGVSEN